MTGPLFDVCRECVLITGVSGQLDAEYFLVPLCQIHNTLCHQCRPYL